MNIFENWFTAFRLKMFAIHLAVSLLFASLSLIWVYFIWHPYPLALAVGVTDIFIMMLVIDTILGPVLTFIVADQTKPSFKFDLSIIALIQISALVYGMYSIAMSRPVWIVFDTARFDLVQARDISSEKIKRVSSPYDQLTFFKPAWSAVKQSQSDAERSQRLFEELETGISPSMQPMLYEALDLHFNQVKQQSLPLSQLYRYNSKREVDEILKQYAKANAWLPLKSSHLDMVVLINKEKADAFKIVNLRPWK